MSDNFIKYFSRNNEGSYILKHMDLKNCRFDNMDLENSIFNNSNLENATFKNCNLLNATFNNCNIKNINWGNSDISTCKFGKCSRVPAYKRNMLNFYKRKKINLTNLLTRIKGIASYDLNTDGSRLLGAM